ncbi:MAG: hypothetical protein HY819_04045 [Acidobacteria bacterium]|nr:hypothetical protein [Acidobacteriota bacterium]
MNNFQFTPTPSPSIAATCTCCFPAQRLVTTGRQAYCPLTERIYDNATTENATRQTEPIVDFYPGRRQKGETAPFAINPAEDRFGQI